MRYVLSLLLVLAVGASSGLAQSPQDTNATAFVGVHVVPMDEEHVLEDQTVLVRGDRIAAVGPSGEVEVPEGARRVEGEGRYLVPGLAEMHGHIPSPEESPAFTEDVLFLYVANGVTTVRGMLGREGQLALRERANRGAVVAPTLYLAGPAFSGGSVDSPEAARERVRQQHEAGWDFLKILGGMSRAEYDAMADAAEAAGIAFVGHVPSEVGLLHALERGQHTIDHLDGYVAYLGGDAGPIGEEALREVARRTRAAGTAVVPTMALWETLQGTAALDTLTGYPELRYMPPQTVEAWTRSHRDRVRDSGFDAEAARHVVDNRVRLLRALHEEGVTILFGTDAPQQFSVPGFSVHREVPRMVQAGMTPYEILATATRHVGVHLEDYDRFGTVAPGARADLLLLEANPLDDLAHLADRAGVMVQGRWLPEAEIQARLEAIASGYAE